MLSSLRIATASIAGLFLSLTAVLICLAPRPLGLSVGLLTRPPESFIIDEEGRLITVHIEPGRELHINGEAATYSTLGEQLEAILKYRAERVLFVIGDPGASYGDVVEAISVARQLTKNVGLFTPLSFPTRAEPVILGPFPLNGKWN